MHDRVLRFAELFTKRKQAIKKLVKKEMCSISHNYHSILVVIRPATAEILHYTELGHLLASSWVGLSVVNNQCSTVS